jgi:large subunit ribosomal protein L15
MHNMTLETLKDTSRPTKVVQRVGRGHGSHRGNHSCRGGKGHSHRSGFRHRHHYEGGQVPLYRKSPIRGFSRGRFLKAWFPISLCTLEELKGGELTLEMLHPLLPSNFRGRIKIVKGKTELKKKFTVHAHGFSATAKDEIEKAGGQCILITNE